MSFFLFKGNNYKESAALNLFVGKMADSSLSGLIMGKAGKERNF